jgi:hypothetical protein
MRFLAGMTFGALLTVVAAYAVDSTRTSAVAAGPAAAANRTMVNWDVVEANWASVKARAKEGWSELRARVDRS